jgi:hypothetical protein
MGSEGASVPLRRFKDNAVKRKTAAEQIEPDDGNL